MFSRRTLLKITFIFILLFLFAIPVFAGDYDAIFSQLKNTLDHINKQENHDIARVGSETITNKEFNVFKAYKETNLKLNGLNSKFNESELLKEFIINKLIIKKAKEENVFVSLNEAKKHAQEMRKLLEESGDKKAQQFQQKMIALTGLSEDEYWTQYAPLQYQDHLSEMNLINKLIKEGVLPDTENNDEFLKAYEKYREGLYHAEKKNISILDKNIKIN